MFGAVFFVSKSLLGIERQRKLKKFALLTRKPRIDVGILIYRTWPIGCGFEVFSRVLNFIGSIQYQFNLLESNPNVHSFLSFTVIKKKVIA